MGCIAIVSATVELVGDDLDLDGSLRTGGWLAGPSGGLTAGRERKVSVSKRVWMEMRWKERNRRRRESRGRGKRARSFNLGKGGKPVFCLNPLSVPKHFANDNSSIIKQKSLMTDYREKILYDGPSMIRRSIRSWNSIWNLHPSGPLSLRFPLVWRQGEQLGRPR